MKMGGAEGVGQEAALGTSLGSKEHTFTIAKVGYSLSSSFPPSSLLSFLSLLLLIL